MWSGVGVFWRTSKKEGEARKPSEVSMMFYVAFVAIELHPDTISGIFA